MNSACSRGPAPRHRRDIDAGHVAGGVIESVDDGAIRRRERDIIGGGGDRADPHVAGRLGQIDVAIGVGIDRARAGDVGEAGDVDQRAGGVAHDVDVAAAGDQAEGIGALHRHGVAAQNA